MKIKKNAEHPMVHEHTREHPSSTAQTRSQDKCHSKTPRHVQNHSRNKMRIGQMEQGYFSMHHDV